MPPINALLRALKWGGRGAARQPPTHPLFQGRRTGGGLPPIAPLNPEDLYSAQRRALIPQQYKTREELAGELVNPLTAERRLPRLTDADLGIDAIDADRISQLAVRGAPRDYPAPLRAFLEAPLRETQEWAEELSPIVRGGKTIPRLQRHVGIKQPRRRAATDIGAADLARAFPATGKYLTDNPEFQAGAARASAYWLNHRGLPGASRALNRQLTHAQGRTEAEMIEGIGKIYDEALPVEREAARFDLNQALLREVVSTSGIERLAKNADALKTVEGTYIQANRIRAMQEMLTQYGHGSQRRLHDISGMLFQRSQDLGRALEEPSLSRFKQELVTWKNLEKFMQRFGRQAFYTVSSMAHARARFPTAPDPLTFGRAAG